MSIIKDIVFLINAGWRLFEGEVERKVYEKQDCPSLHNRRISPKWFSQGDKYLCVGCAKKCSLVRPAGFQARLELLYPEKHDQRYLLTPEEMLNRLKLLTVDQVAYCLNVSPGKVYKMLARSELASTDDNPKRVPVEEIKAYLDRVC